MYQFFGVWFLSVALLQAAAIGDSGAASLMVAGQRGDGYDLAVVHGQGVYVVGQLNSKPTVFVMGTSVTTITLPSGDGVATCISPDGAYIGGALYEYRSGTTTIDKLHAKVWRRTDPSQNWAIPLIGGKTSNLVLGLSNSGVAVGGAGTFSASAPVKLYQPLPFKWTQAGGVAQLATDPGGFGTSYGAVCDISADGGTAVGYVASTLDRLPARWIGSTLKVLQYDPFAWGIVFGISPNGRLMVGEDNDGEIAYWDNSENLSDPPKHSFDDGAGGHLPGRGLWALDDGTFGGHGNSGVPPPRPRFPLVRSGLDLPFMVAAGSVLRRLLAKSDRFGVSNLRKLTQKGGSLRG